MVEMWLADPRARRTTQNLQKRLNGLVSDLSKPPYPDFYPANSFTPSFT